MTGAAVALAVDTVLFDLGGVLIDWNPRYVYREHFGRDVAAMEDFLARVVPMTWNHEMDAGKPFDEAVRERQALFPEHAGRIALWRDRWPDMLGGPIEPTVGLLRELRGAGRRLIALTNWSAETFPVARARYGFLDWFEAIFVSGEERLAKPDPRFFELASTRGALVPSRTLFIDDNLANIETAASMGFDTHRFVDPEALRSALVERRLISGG
jgi:2-haloacid dehalogenase